MYTLDTYIMFIVYQFTSTYNVYVGREKTSSRVALYAANLSIAVHYSQYFIITLYLILHKLFIYIYIYLCVPTVKHPDTSHHRTAGQRRTEPRPVDCARPGV